MTLKEKVADMDPLGITAIVVAIIVTTGAGFGAGVGIGGAAQAKNARKSIEAHTQSIVELQAGNAALLEGQTAMLEQATRPIVIDAEIRDDLAQVPVQCRTAAGGDPMSALCAWATCLQYGQSSAQRPECEDVRDAAIEALQKPECPEVLPEVE